MTKPSRHARSHGPLAGPRPGSYARQSSPEHELIAQSLRDDPRYREQILQEAAVNEAMEGFRNDRYPSLRLLRRLLLRPVYWLLIRAGIHPLALPNAWVFGGRGGLVRQQQDLFWGGRRNAVNGSFPVAGRPRFFSGKTLFGFAI